MSNTPKFLEFATNFLNHFNGMDKEVAVEEIKNLKKAVLKELYALDKQDILIDSALSITKEDTDKNIEALLICSQFDIRSSLGEEEGTFSLIFTYLETFYTKVIEVCEDSHTTNELNILLRKIYSEKDKLRKNWAKQSIKITKANISLPRRLKINCNGLEIDFEEIKYTHNSAIFMIKNEIVGRLYFIDSAQEELLSEKIEEIQKEVSHTINIL